MKRELAKVTAERGELKSELSGFKRQLFETMTVLVETAQSRDQFLSQLETLTAAAAKPPEP